MSERFRPCPECGYAVPDGAPHCPDCGLLPPPPPSLLRRLVGRKGPRHHPENLRALERRLGEEIARLTDQAEHLGRTRGTLQERLGEARAGGRDPGPLLEALRGLDDAIAEARQLGARQQAVLAGIAVQRDHNALHAFVAEAERGGDAEGLIALLEDPLPGQPIGTLPLDLAPAQLCASPCGRWLAAPARFGSLLLIWDLATPGGAPRSIPIPEGELGPLVFGPGPALLALGCGRVLRLLDPEKGTWLAVTPLPRGAEPTALAFGPEAGLLLVGTSRGELLPCALGGIPGAPMPRLGRAVEARPAAPVRGLAIGPDGLRAWSSGGALLRCWWLRDGGLLAFSERRVDGGGPLVPDRAGERVALGLDGEIALFDAGLARQLGRFTCDGTPRMLAFAPDGERLLTLAGDRLLLGSPASRRALTLRPGRPVPHAAAAAPGAEALFLVSPAGAAELVCERVDLLSGGFAARSRRAAALLDRSLEQARRLSAEHGLERIASLAEERNLALRSQLRAWLRDAGMAVVYTVTRRAQAAEELLRAGREPALSARVLDELFAELEDLHALLHRALPLAPDLEGTLAKLTVLPIAVLRGQVDALLQAVEATLRSTADGAEGEQRAALDRLHALEHHVETLERLANELSGPFWGNPERPLLVEALHRLRREFPGWIDAMLARIASAAIGRMDPVEEAFALDRLRERRARIAGQAGEVAAEADWLLENALGHGPLGKDETERSRRQAERALDEEWRRLDAETRAFLETQRAGKGAG